jgi:valyl-tRNA synthetase
MMAPAGPYKGMPVKKARKKLAEDLREAGLLQRIDEEYTNNLSVCYKCGKFPNSG